MASETQSRILELHIIAQNASEEHEKVMVNMNIVHSHLKHLIEKLEMGSSGKLLTDEHILKQEIAEWKRQLVSLKNQSIILRREKLDANIRKKNLLRNQTKAGEKAKLQENTRKVESKLKLLSLSNMCDSENEVEDVLKPGNNNFIKADNENNQEESVFTPVLMKKQHHNQDILASLASRSTISTPLKVDAENNLGSLMIPSHVNESGADQKFTAIKCESFKTSPIRDWSGRDQDVCKSSSQSEDLSVGPDPMGVVQRLQARVAKCRQLQSRPHAKRVQEMKDLALIKTDFKTVGHEGLNVSDPELKPKPKLDVSSLPTPQFPCICLRPLKMILCICGNWFIGRVRTICPDHPQDELLLDVYACSQCNNLSFEEYDMAKQDGGQLYNNYLKTNWRPRI